MCRACPGIGPKTASQLIQAVRRPRDGARRAPTRSPSRKLQAVADRPCRRWRGCRASWCGWCAMRRCPSRSTSWSSRASRRSRCAEFLEDQGFKSLLARLDGGGTVAGGGAAAAAASMTSWRRSTRSRQVRARRADRGRPLELRDGDRRGRARPLDRRGDGAGLCRDRHRDRLHRLHHRAKLAGISLATAPQPRLLHPASGTAAPTSIPTRPSQLPMQLVLDRLKPLLEDPAVLKIGHNFKYDWVMFDKRGIDVAPIDDTMVMSFDLDAGRSFGHGLDELAKLHFDHECIPFKELCGTGAKQITFDKVPLDRGDRICRPRMPTSRCGCGCGCKPRLPHENVTRVYERVDRPLVAGDRRGWSGAGSRSTATIWRGCQPRVRRRDRRARGADLRGGVRAVHDRLARSSSASAVTSRLGLKGGRKGKSGHYSTDVTELERLAARGRASARRLVLEWRQLTKLKSTYTDALQAQINPRDRPGPHQLLADRRADRAAVVERPQPAEHPDPHRDRPQDPRRLRRRAGLHVCSSADYSQIELRLAAHMADVPQLKEAFRARRRHPQPDRGGAVRHASTATRATRPRRSTSRSSTASRRWGLAGRLGRAQGRRQGDHRPLFRALPRHPRLHPRDARRSSASTASPRPCSAGRPISSRTSARPTRRSAAAPSARRSTRRSRAPAPTSSSGRWRGWTRRWRRPASTACGCCSRSTTSWCSKCPTAAKRKPRPVIKQVMADAAEPAMTLDVPLDVEVGWGEHWGAAH